MSISYTDFVSALRMRESSGNYEVKNPFGYLGAYQFGEGALIDLGFVNNDGNWRDNNYSGGWTGLYGIDSTAEFLNSPEAQDRAADAWFPLMWSYLVGRGADTWLGETVAGITVTASGLIAGAHLLGQGVVLRWLESGGDYDPVDQMGTPVSEYIEMFNGFAMPFDTGEPELQEFAALLETMPENLAARFEKAYEASGRLTLADNEADPTLIGSNRKDALLGLETDDLLVGRKGNDALAGGDGSDILRANNGADVVVGGAGDDVIRGHRGNDWLWGNADDDLLAGGRGNDRLVGGLGNDTLVGGGGRDRLAGNEGDDTLTGGAGRDVFVFADLDGHDLITDFDAQGGDQVDLSGLAEIDSFGDLINGYAQQIGSDVVIETDAQTRLTLADTTLDDLTADAFLF